MTADDENELSRMREQERNEFETCRRVVGELQLPMKFVDVEHIFGGERIVIYYLAENRVDFRELVKTLAGEFQTRIEMRQIGVRDEAKLLADYGDCGKPVCCNTHLSDMPPVSMKMAKLQKATLDPTKISGRCGRLNAACVTNSTPTSNCRRICPRSARRSSPPRDGCGVLAHEILASQLLVETEDRTRVMIAPATS